MAALDWPDCPLVEVLPGKVSRAPLLKNTRLPVEDITGNYDAFRDEGLSPEAAVAETPDKGRLRFSGQPHGVQLKKDQQHRLDPN